MKVEDRRKGIMDLLSETGSVSVDKLMQHFGVSKMTIHRDLDELECVGLLRKMRGGASIETSIQFESDYHNRERQATAEKRAIAAAVTEFVEPGMTVLIDDGTTARLVAEAVIAKHPITIISNNQAVLTALAETAGVTVISLGGTFSKKFNGFFGLVTEASVSQLRADLVVISTPAISGATCFHMEQEVVRAKRAMMAAGDRRLLVADHGKFGRSALYRLASVAEFDAVVTDRPLSAAVASALSEADVRVITAGN